MAVTKAPAGSNGQAEAPDLPFYLTTPGRSRRDIKMLVYGVVGIGKTSLMASAARCPEMRDVLMVDIEAGDSAIKRYGSRITSVQVRTFESFARTYEFLRAHCRYRDADDVANMLRLERKFAGDEFNVGDEPRRFRTVIIDSLSETQRLNMDRIKGVVGDRYSFDTDLPAATLQDYGRGAESLRYVIRCLRDLPLNVLIVCGEEEKDDERKRRIKRPALPGKLATEVPGYMDVVGWFAQAGSDDEGEIVRRLHIQPGEQFIAKNRLASDKVRYLDTPTMRDITNVADEDDGSDLTDL